jgi:KaiC/GvpD/RAD55 family RecA-like ATPase
MLIDNTFKALTTSDSFFRATFAHLKREYFEEREDLILFDKYTQFVAKYNHIPNLADLKLLIEGDNKIGIEKTEELNERLKIIHKSIAPNEELLITEVENWCQNRALQIALMNALEIMDNGGEKAIIGEKIKEALGIHFVVKIGNDFKEDYLDRLKVYQEKEEVMPLDILHLNRLLNGGLRKKTVTCFLGRVNIGKSLILCHVASSMMASGKNVLYITAEMSEYMIAKRMDANLLDIPMKELGLGLKKKFFETKIGELKAKTSGNLIVKEYPTCSANANHIRSLLNEIKIKKGYVPDVVVLDYLNIFTSYRLTGAASANSYSYVKSIAEEMRQIAVEFDCAIVTATQTNRGGFKQNHEELDMTSTSESIGLPATVDSLIGILQSEEMRLKYIFAFKNLKSRFDSNINEVVVTGVEYIKMRLINAKEEDQMPVTERDAMKVADQQNQKQIEVKKPTIFDFDD